MRITIDITSAVKPDPTGIGNYVTSLVQTLLDLDKENWYTLGIRPKRFFRKRYVEELGKKQRVPKLPLIPPYYPLLTGPIDLFHALGVRLPERGKFRKIVTIHDLNTIDSPELTSPEWSQNRARRIRETIGRADGIITPSEFTKERVLEHFPGFDQECIRVIWHGVDLDHFKPQTAGIVEEAKKKHGLTKPYILHIGAFVPRKNKSHLLRAFSRSKIAREGELVFIGSKRGNYPELAAEVDKLGLQDRVRFLGFIAQPEIPPLLAGARVFAFPSFYEGFGLPVLEAMAAGVPTAAAKASCLPEVGGDAVEYFDPQSEDSIAAALEALWDDESKRKECSEKGVARAKLLTWKHCAQNTLQFYKDIYSMDRHAPSVR